MSNEEKMREYFERKHESFVREDKQWIMYGYDEGVKACAAIKDAEIAEARKTAEYWKSEHLAGNKEIAARDLMIKDLQHVVTIACVSSCTCCTKTPEYTYHKENCRYRVLREALAKSEHHNSRALEKMLLEAELKGLATPDFEFVEKHNDIRAKLAELNKE